MSDDRFQLDSDGAVSANCLHYCAVRAANSIAREMKGDEIATPSANI